MSETALTSRCVVCSEPLWLRVACEYRGDPMHMIIGPGSRTQMSTVCTIFCARCGLKYDREPAAAPLAPSEEARAAVSDCAATDPLRPAAWCCRPEGHTGRHEYVVSTVRGPYRAPSPDVGTRGEGEDGDAR